MTRLPSSVHAMQNITLSNCAILYQLMPAVLTGADYFLKGIPHARKGSGGSSRSRFPNPASKQTHPAPCGVPPNAGEAATG